MLGTAPTAVVDAVGIVVASLLELEEEPADEPADEAERAHERTAAILKASSSMRAMDNSRMSQRASSGVRRRRGRSTATADGRSTWRRYPPGAASTRKEGSVGWVGMGFLTVRRSRSSAAMGT